MFIRNIKLNGKIIFKIVFIVFIILVLIMGGVGVYKICDQKEQVVSSRDDLSNNKVNVIKASNYANVLKSVHSNLNQYVGMKIKFTGFVYRLYDFTDEQFVLGRQMIISSDMQAVIVGFLCHMNGANKYNDAEWVEVEGKITKGDYHGEIPVIEVYSIKKAVTPSDEYVYPPDGSYVETSAII